MQDQNEAEFKFIIIGDSGVGKTCILHRLKYDDFLENHDVTVGVTFMTQMMQIGSTQLKLQLWDTAGQEIFRSITQSYYHDSKCAIIVYDITNPQSFANLAQWIEDVKNHAPSDCTIAIVGNKTDLTKERRISTQEAKALADAKECPFFETSARTGYNIQALFEECALIVFSNAQRNGGSRERRVSSVDATIWIDQKTKEKEGSCC